MIPAGRAQLWAGYSEAAVGAGPERYANLLAGRAPGYCASLGASDAVMAFIAAFYLIFPRHQVLLRALIPHAAHRMKTCGAVRRVAWEGGARAAGPHLPEVGALPPPRGLEPRAVRERQGRREQPGAGGDSLPLRDSSPAVRQFTRSLSAAAHPSGVRQVPAAAAGGSAPGHASLWRGLLSMQVIMPAQHLDRVDYASSASRSC